VQHHIGEVVELSKLIAQKASMVLEVLQNLPKMDSQSLQKTSKSLDASLKNFLKNPHGIIKSGILRN